MVGRRPAQRALRHRRFGGRSAGAAVREHVRGATPRGRSNRLPLASRGPLASRNDAGPGLRAAEDRQTGHDDSSPRTWRAAELLKREREVSSPSLHDTAGPWGRRAEVRQPRRAAPTQRGRARGGRPPQRDQGGNRARKPSLARRRRATSSRRREQAQRHDAAGATDPMGVAEGTGTGAVRVRAGPPRGHERVVGRRPPRRGQARRRQAAGPRVRPPRRANRRRGRRAPLPP